MKVAALARGLALSRTAVAKLIARGMPATSVAEAQAWRVANLHPGRRKRTRLDDAAEEEARLLADVERLGRDASNGVAGALELLRYVLADELTEEQLDRVRLRPEVWAATLGLPWPPDPRVVEH